MTFGEQAQARQEKSDARKAKWFDEFLAKPSTKLILSLVPPSEHDEALRTLLSEAFDAGFTTGVGDALSAVAEALLKGPPKER